jgi:sugar phosphate isomerase/epimerase
VRLSFSTISTVNASFAEDVDAYRSAGFDAIGLWEMKLPEDDDANRELLRTAGLVVANCLPAVPSFLQLAIPGLEGPADPAERSDAICASIRRLAPFEPESIVVLSGPLGSFSESEARAILADGLRRAAAVARDEGVRLGFEPIHPAQRESTAFVNTVAHALAVLDDAGLDDVGVMADSYNLATEGPDAVVRALDRVTGLHVADWPRDDVGAGPRALPGEGRGEAAAFVAALRAAGWDGTLDVEIFSTPEEFWSLPATEAARRAFAAAVQLV